MIGKRSKQLFGVFISAALSPTAPADPLHAAEKAACTQGATRLCSGTYSLETKLLACMKANKAALSPAYSAALEVGIKRRSL